METQLVDKNKALLGGDIDVVAMLGFVILSIVLLNFDISCELLEL